MNYIDVNDTPHAVKVYADNGDIIADLPTSGTVYRLTETSAMMFGDWDEIVPQVEVRLGSVTPDLPPIREGVRHIVSMPLLMGMKAAGVERPDFYYPYDMVRDEAGRILGCRSFARLA